MPRSQELVIFFAGRQTQDRQRNRQTEPIALLYPLNEHPTLFSVCTVSERSLYCMIIVLLCFILCRAVVSGDSSDNEIGKYTITFVLGCSRGDGF